MSPIKSSRLSLKITALIVIAWLALIGFLVKDRYSPTETLDEESIDISAVESDDWFIIRIRGSYAGFARSRQIRKGKNWSIRDDLRISLNLQGHIKPVVIANESVVDKEFRLVSFNTRISSGVISFEMSGQVEGDSILLNAPAQKGGGTTRLKLGERPRMARSLGLPLPLTGLEVGDVMRLPVFDPMEGSKSESIIRVLEHASVIISGENFEAWRVRAEYRSMDVIMWVDEKGSLVKGILPLGITVVRATRKEIENSMGARRDLPELLAMTAAPVEGVIPDPRNLEKLTLELTSGPNIRPPNDAPRQIVKGGVITLTRPPLPEASYRIPYKGQDKQEYLASSRFITSENEEIIERGQEIVGDETDPVKAATMINEWVYEYLKKTPTPAVPNAHEVLKSKYGDCNEHAVLAAALSRAVGIPCRIAVGLMYMRDGFYYHAWVSYWSGERWFSGDPLTGQMPVDVTHIALMFGDVDKHLNVISYLGKIKFRVL
jgi:hypothetical protein